MPKLTPADVRALFPATARACYLNAAASSPLAIPVEKALTDHHREAMEWGDVGVEAWVKRRDDTRKRFAKFIGAKVEEVAFTTSTSVGVHLTGQFLLQHGVREVVTLEGEFPTSTLPLLHLGLRLRVVKARPDGTYHLDDVADAIGRRTGAFVASAVQYASGFRLDLEAAGRLCRSRKLFFVVNGAQALGQVPIDVVKARADFLCGTSHKWMMAGFGAGMFYVSSRVLKASKLPVASWLSVEHPFAMNNLAGATVRGRASKRRPWFEAKGAKFRKDAAALELGVSSFGVIFGLEAALGIHEGVGVERTLRHNLGLQRLLRSRLRERGFVPNLPDDPGVGSGSCVFPVAGDASAAVRELQRKSVVVTPRGGGLRVSTHVFNSEEDVEQLLWALEQCGIRPAGAKR